ncbi:lipoate--protein ligase family protein [bacterium]|nr:lipoate--protein ligase family protein [bacterium]
MPFNSMQNWSLITDGPHTGPYNMAADWVLLRHSGRPVLRFYGWDQPALTIGWSQSMDQLNTASIIDADLPVVRRPTGGRAIYHEGELTYSVTLPGEHPILKLSIMESYRVISEALVEGLRLMGIQAQYGRGERNLYSNPSCFASTSRYEVVVEGKKVIGSAQRRVNTGLIQQGTILIDQTYLHLENYTLQRQGSSLLQNKSISLQEILGRIPQRSQLIKCLTESFSRKFEVDFEEFDSNDDYNDSVNRLLKLNEFYPFKKQIVLDIENC